MRTRHRANMVAAVLSMALAAAPAASQPLTADQQRAMLESPDPRLAANKKLVYDMYREVLQAGKWQRIPAYIGPEYKQHNPNVVDGTEALAAFIRGSRPERPVEDSLGLPVVSIIAEGDFVVISFVRPEKDAEGKPYLTTWFDMYRVRNGKLVEHWDPALKGPEALKMDPNSKRLP
jgi:predicted SnoaL-like aldol condensation-catalyzing enzyme